MIPIGDRLEPRPVTHAKPAYQPAGHDQNQRYQTTNRIQITKPMRMRETATQSNNYTIADSLSYNLIGLTGLISPRVSQPKTATPAAPAAPATKHTNIYARKRSWRIKETHWQPIWPEKWRYLPPALKVPYVARWLKIIVIIIAVIVKIVIFVVRAYPRAIAITVHDMVLS